jgi:hypothetical protein
MKKIILVFLPILLIYNNIFSQEETTNERKWAVKAYVNGSYTSIQSTSTLENGEIQTYEKFERNIGNISPAISYTKGKFLQELELTNLRINQTGKSDLVEIPGQNVVIFIDGDKIRSTQIGLRYLASGVFRPFKSKKISLGIGGSAQPSFSRSKIFPYSSASFTRKSFGLGIGIAAVPQIEYDFTKRFFINLSLPFEIFDVSFTSYHTTNPILPESERRTSDADADFFPKRYHLRMGLGVRF